MIDIGNIIEECLDAQKIIKEATEYPWKPGEGVGDEYIPRLWETEETVDEYRERNMGY